MMIVEAREITATRILNRHLNDSYPPEVLPVRVGRHRVLGVHLSHERTEPCSLGNVTCAPHSQNLRIRSIFFLSSADSDLSIVSLEFVRLLCYIHARRIGTAFDT